MMQPQPVPPATYRPRPLAAVVQVVIALFAVGFAAFAIFEVGGEVKGAAKPFFIVPGLLIALMAIMPARAAAALFRGSSDAQARTDRVQGGCGLPMALVFVLGLGALVKSAIGDEAISELVPYLVLIGVAFVLAMFVGPALARR